MLKIGYIGAGAMGGPMIGRFSKAYPSDVLVFDQNSEVARKVAKATGVRTTTSVAEIAGASDILFSCLPNNAVIRQVYLGESGVASATKPGSISIDCSTVGPDATRDVYETMKDRGTSHLDASMLGSVKQAKEGTISFVVGGDADAFERARPVLEVCGQMIRHCGPSGAGNHMKLIHQTLVAGHAVAVAEAMGLCLETGADIEAFYDIVTQGTGFAYSRYFENRVPRMRDGDYSPLFMLQFMLKDARLARDMVEEAEDRYPALSAVVATLEEADANGWGSDDFSAAMKVIESRSGKSIKRG